MSGCPACGESSSRRYGSRGSLRLAACARCGLVYSDPQPRDRVREVYLSEYDLAAHFGARTRRKEILFERRLSELPAPVEGRNRLCDIGCGDGQFLELAARGGWIIEGIELNPPAAARARERGAKVFEGALEELEELPWGSYDLVTSWDVLEHTPDPRPFAERLNRLMAPAAKLALTTLNREALVSRRYGMDWSMVAKDHFTYWDRDSLTQLLENSGLVVDELSTFGVGRDFFSSFDRIQRWSPRASRKAGQESEPGHVSGRTWDTWPPVLLAERAMNRALTALGGGIELYVIASKRTTD